MQLRTPPSEAVPAGLRAMKMVATVGHPITPAAANMIAGAQRVLLRTNIALEDLAPITPAELGRTIVDPALRLQLVQGMLMLSLADGPPSPAQMTLVESFAVALAVDGPGLRSLRLLADKHTLFFKLHFLRHSHLGEVMERQIREGGLLAPVKGVLGMRGLYEDPELAARYRKLEDLPEDTLGFAFTTYIHHNKFGYPGEKGGFPEAGIWHDFGHVLTGYGTDPEGELEMVGFQAGYRENNALFMLLFGALTFSAGVNVTPLPQGDSHGIFARAGLPERVFAAIERGSKLSVDLFEGWDPWDYVELPIEEARVRLNVLPA